MNKRIILSIVFSISVLSLSAQVTIGSDIAPIEGALLDIKTQTANTSTNVTATKGVVFPRVQLISKTSLKPLVTTETSDNKKSHIGTIVYNLKEVTSTAATPPVRVGLNVWDGNQWSPLANQGTPNFLYMPRFELPLSGGGNKTFNLYNEYKRQFSPHATYVTSEGATYQVPGVYAATDFIYAVLEYDASVITVTSITKNGVLNYTVKSTTAPSLSYITVVLVVKD